MIYDIYIFLLVDTFSFQGTKYVIKQVPNTRKQFLIMDGEAIIAFVEKGTKFGQCAEYMDITSKIQCKVLRFNQYYMYYHQYGRMLSL